MVDKTAAQEIRDDIISQDVRYQRANSTVRREVNDRLDMLESDVIALMTRIDVNGAKRTDARQRRLKKLNRELGQLIRAAYSEINVIIKTASRRIAKVESKNINKIVKENLP